MVSGPKAQSRGAEMAGRVPEPRAQRLLRHGRRQALYLRAGLVIVLLAALIALIVANTRQVEIDWVLGTTRTSLVWIVFVATVIGCLLGVLCSALFRRRTRRPGVDRVVASDDKEALG